MIEPCVYILTNAKKTVLYTGVTSNIRQRVLEHRNGIGSEFTRKYRMKVLLMVERHPTMMSAIAREKQIKSWSRARKEALINETNPAWDDLMPIGE
ncbi:MAG: GIY-YIG nuclease family protein [Alistipes sp.]|nr:GIY-YIG nuclease family protein [Alistipes sp.]